MATNIPQEINLHQKSACLTLKYTEQSFDLPAEYLRVYSPSAEVKGHGPGQEKLQVGKENVSIQTIVPVGNYAIQIIYDDGHDTGIYSWSLLQDYAARQDRLMANYLDRLDSLGLSRDA